MPAGRKKLMWSIFAILLIIAFVAPVLAYLIGGETPAPPADLLIVYDDKSKAAAQLLEEWITSNYKGLRVKLVPASQFKVEFRAYPTVLVMNPQAVAKTPLFQFLRVYHVGDKSVPILAYDAMLDLANILSLRSGGNATISLRYNASLYIIDGYGPGAGLQVVTAQVVPALLPLLEALFAAKLPVAFVELNYTQARKMGIPVDQLQVLPAFVVKSDYNLTDGTVFVTYLGNGYYTLAPSVMRQLDEQMVQAGFIRVYELRVTPPNTATMMLVGNASAPVKVAVYWDFLCPYSKKFEEESFPILLRYAKEGKVALYIADYLIHPEAYKLHQLAHCIYQKYGAEKLLEYIPKAFAAIDILMGKSNMTLDEYANMLAKEFNVTHCDYSLPTPMVNGAQELGVRGTPTVAVWGGRLPSNWVALIVGAQPPIVYREFIDWALGVPVITIK